MTTFNYQPEGLETIQDFVRWGGTLFLKAELYFGHGTDNAFDEAKTLVFYVLSLPYELPDRYWLSRLTDTEKFQVTDFFIRRIETRKPSAYLTGEAWFCGLKFLVNEHTLVPRSPISELIEDEFKPWIDPPSVKKILDMCTGSGCIGIASLKVCAHAEVDLVDISKDALEVAKKNVAQYQLEGIANPIQSDLFEALDGRLYDLIVANPPYVDQIEMTHLPAEFKQEPKIGLAAGEDGLKYVRKILAQAANFLNDDGTLIVEVGVSQHHLQQTYPELPFYWFDLKNGGEGVFAIQKSELQVFGDILKDRAFE